MIKKIYIEGMSCGHCVARVEKALKNIEDVKSVNVDLKEKVAVIEVNNDIDHNVLTETIDSIGYQVSDIK